MSLPKSQITPSDMQSEDGDTSDDLDEKDEKTEDYSSTILQLPHNSLQVSPHTFIPRGFTICI